MIRLFALAVALAPTLLVAQERAPMFRAGVTTVLVDALALDADGNPVAGLSAEDFELFEDGVPQTIASFDVTDWTSYVGARDEARAQPTADVNPTAGAYPRRFIFVLNRQGARFDWLNRAKRALSAFVVESMADGDEAMVIEIGYSWDVTQEFRAGKESTLETVRKLSQMRLDYPMGPDRAAGEIYRNLEALGDELGTTPGRKVLVLLSNELATYTRVGSVRSNEGFSLKRAVDALNQANVSAYTIDLRGPESTLSVTGGLSPLASETGGRFFRNAIAFETPLARIGRENARYYLMSYVPTNSDKDGTYREIEVRSTDPAIQVVARRGYFARALAASSAVEPEEPKPAEPSREAGLRPSAMTTTRALPAAVEMMTYILPSANNTARVPLSVALPRELLDAVPRTLLVELSQDGRSLHRFEESVDFERYYLVDNVELSPGSYLMAITVSDGEQAVYRASTNVVVPDRFGERFGLSSVVPVLPPNATQNVGDDIPILPTTTLARGADAFVLFQVFAGTERPSEQAYLNYTIYDDAGDDVGSGGKNGPMELSDRGEGTPVLLRIPMADLSAGAYRVDIRVEDRSRGRRAASEIELRIR